MKFTIAIKDEFGNVLSEHETTAEAQHIVMMDSYEFVFKAFHLMIDSDTYYRLLERKDTTND